MPRSENEAQMIRDMLEDEKTGGVVDGPKAAAWRDISTDLAFLDRLREAAESGQTETEIHSQKVEMVAAELEISHDQAEAAVAPR